MEENDDIEITEVQNSNNKAVIESSKQTNGSKGKQIFTGKFIIIIIYVFFTMACCYETIVEIQPSFGRLKSGRR